MSGSLNRATLIGRVGQEPEHARMQSGKPVCKFSLATTESWKDQQGERQERTTWHNIVIYSEGLCNLVEQYVRKGSRLYIEGSISNRSYEKDGQKRWISEVVLQGFESKIIMLDNKLSDSSQSNQSSNESSYADYQGDGQPSDDIPF